MRDFSFDLFSSRIKVMKANILKASIPSYRGSQARVCAVGQEQAMMWRLARCLQMKSTQKRGVLVNVEFPGWDSPQNTDICGLAG